MSKERDMDALLKMESLGYLTGFRSGNEVDVEELDDDPDLLLVSCR
jgi:hypothetical protein